MTSAVFNRTLRNSDVIRSLLDRAVFELENEGIENCRYEAEQLLAHCLKIERWELYTASGRGISPSEKVAFNRSLKARLDHQPLSYIRGWTGFYNQILKTDKRGLIPRPETEVLVDRALNILKQCPVLRPALLDLGCGSGNIALALAGEDSRTEISASDISLRALELARENARDLGLAERVTFRQGDLFEPWVDRRESGFDLILSNPPYLSRHDLAIAPPEVIRNEPLSALDGGPDGMSIIRRLIRGSSDFLKPGGWLIIEIGADQGEETRRIVDANEGLKFFEITRDYSGRDRVVSAYKF